MRKLNLLFSLFLITTQLFAQLVNKTSFNRSLEDLSDPKRPWIVGGIRSIKVTNDLDGDGKVEILATDQSATGRVHVLEYVGNDTLEVVWSSPTGEYSENPNSTPRWVEYGDLDGDGKMEIIFPDGPRYEGKVNVFETKGDNDWGTTSILSLNSNAFAADGIGNFRMDRERATVYDFDGDGNSEFIMQNQDNNVYILGIHGNAPGFAKWEVEGGSPVSVKVNGGTLTSGSIWQSIPADIDGDGKIEIINHHWNNFALWSIDVNGTKSYGYPTAGNPGGGASGPVFYSYMNEDAVAFMGLQTIDVDNDGKDEIVGVVYPTFDVVLISQPMGAYGVEIWNDPSQVSIIKTREQLQTRSGLEYWACYAADLNKNGIKEILVGGFYGENVIAIEYNGFGDIKADSSYLVTYYYKGEKEYDTDFETITISDSAGIIDTIYSMKAWENPGVMKMSSGDILGNSDEELVICYQSGSYIGTQVYDSTKIISRTYIDTGWVETSKFVYNYKNIGIRVLQYEGPTGIKSTDLLIVTPNEYKLEQNYPNPFNSTTTISFILPLNKNISFIIYDMLGNEVKTLINNQNYLTGSHEIMWDGTNNFNQLVASGNYIATLKYGNYSKSIKMTLVK